MSVTLFSGLMGGVVHDERTDAELHEMEMERVLADLKRENQDLRERVAGLKGDVAREALRADRAERELERIQKERAA